MGSPGSSSGGSMNGDARAASDTDVVEMVQIPHQHARLLAHALTPMHQALVHSHLGKTIGDYLTVVSKYVVDVPAPKYIFFNAHSECLAHLGVLMLLYV